MEENMKFHGLNKTTLVDYPGNIACTLFTGGCNLRCPFCQNSSLVLNPESEPYIDDEELTQFLEKRKTFLDGVCITGGEPLLQNDLESFCVYLKSLGYKVKLDTNGTFPDKLQNLLDKNLLDYVAMDIKSSKEGYAKAAGIEGLNISKIERSVEILKSTKVAHEFRTTLVKEFHTIKELISIAKWIGSKEKLYLQTFSDKGTNIEDGLHGFSEKEEKAIKNVLKTYIDFVKIRGI